MYDDAHSIADDLLRNGYDRWLRLEEEKAAIGDDLKELFAELKGQGFTPKALRESFRRVRNADSVDQQEHDAIVDLYVASLTRARPARTREASYSEAKGRGDAVGRTDAIPFDPETGELTDTQESGCSYSEASISAVSPASDESETDDVGATASSTYSPETANEVPAQDGGGTALDASHGGKSNAARPASVDAHVNGGRLAGEVSAEAVTVVGDESGTLTNSHSQASSSQPANSVWEAPSSSPASPARHSDEDIPAFIKQDKPGCLKLKDGHCRISFATSALCAECNQHRAISRASA